MKKALVLILLLIPVMAYADMQSFQRSIMGMYAKNGACTPTETPETSCSDTIDNDCDGNADGADSDCSCSDYSDNFNRSSSTNLGANWVEEFGSWEIVSDTEMRGASTNSYSVSSVRYATPTDSLTQYGKFKLRRSASPSDDSGGAAFRWNTSTGEYYILSLGSFDNKFFWRKVTGSTDNGAVHAASDAVTYNDNWWVAWEVSGTGVGTTLKIWYQATDPGDHASWGSPLFTQTPEYARYADDGLYVGLYSMIQSYTTKYSYFDDFFAGPCQ